MYVSENKKVMKLAKILEGKGMLSRCYSHAVVCYEDMVYFEKCCDDATLDVCIEVIRGLRTEQDVWRWLYTTDVLKCEPRVLDGCLVYGFWRYLQWCGFCYAVTATQSRHYTRVCSYVALHRALKHIHRPEAKHLVLTTALLTTALCYYKPTKQLLSTESGVAMLEDFILQDFRKFCSYEGTLGMKNLFQYVSEFRGDNPVPRGIGKSDVVVQLEYEDTGAVFGSFVMSKEKISVTSIEDNVYVTRELIFPDWVTVMAEDKSPALCTFGVGAYETIVKLFVEFLFHYSGLIMSVSGIYSVMRHKKIVLTDQEPIVGARLAVFEAVHAYYSA